MVGQGPMRRLTTLRSSSSAMRKMGETLMRRELRATRIPNPLLVKSGPLKQMARRAPLLGMSRLLQRQPGQRPLGPRRQSQDLLPQSLPHLHLTEALLGTGVLLETTQIVEALPASPQHLRMKMRPGGSGENNLHLRFLWRWSGPGGDEKRRSAACRRSVGQPAQRNSSGSMKSLGHLTSGLKQSLLLHLLPLLLPLLHHL